MMSNNFRDSNIKLNVITILYFILALFYVLILILLLTSGSIKQDILENILLLFPPLLLPLFLSFVGLRKFRLEITPKYIKTYSDCILMSKVSDDYKDNFVVKKSDYSSNYEDTSIFGLKRNLVLVYKKKDKEVKKKINISFLSLKERRKLQKYLISQ
jgi:hypothetical protein